MASKQRSSSGGGGGNLSCARSKPIETRISYSLPAVSAWKQRGPETGRPARDTHPKARAASVRLRALPCEPVGMLQVVTSAIHPAPVGLPEQRRQ